ncbi:MAG: universal stress protein [Deltaproteobacteria bacterium]|nr:universal stress protein [Deltaproteobacteria bacterium]
MQYKTIVCPVDATELADAALSQAAYVASISGAKLILLNVVEKWYRSAHVATDSPEWQHLHEDWLKEGEKLLQDIAAKARERGVKDLEMVAREGDAAHEIVALAVEKRADLVVMATHRYSPVGKLFMGSVTDKVSRHSPCPVMWVYGSISRPA